MVPGLFLCPFEKASLGEQHSYSQGKQNVSFREAQKIGKSYLTILIELPTRKMYRQKSDPRPGNSVGENSACVLIISRTHARTHTQLHKRARAHTQTHTHTDRQKLPSV